MQLIGLVGVDRLGLPVGVDDVFRPGGRVEVRLIGTQSRLGMPVGIEDPLLELGRLTEHGELVLRPRRLDVLTGQDPGALIVEAADLFRRLLPGERFGSDIPEPGLGEVGFLDQPYARDELQRDRHQRVLGDLEDVLVVLAVDVDAAENPTVLELQLDVGERGTHHEQRRAGRPSKPDAVAS